MKLRIIKNKKVVDNNNQFTYAVEIFDNDGEFFEDYIFKINSTKYMLPDDNSFSYEGIINQLQMSNQFTERNFDCSNPEIEIVEIE